MSIINSLPKYIIPAVLLIILSTGIYKKVKVFDVFVEGAKEGISTILKIAPLLLGLFVSIGIFRASGALDILVYIIKPIAVLLHIPPEIIPLAIIRPISGSASLAVVSDNLKTYGADSFIGKVVSTMMGSTETIFYTLTVYLGAVGIKKIRYTLLAALIAEICGILVSVWVCRLIYGG